MMVEEEDGRVEWSSSKFQCESELLVVVCTVYKTLVGSSLRDDWVAACARTTGRPISDSEGSFGRPMFPGLPSKAIVISCA